MSSASVFGVLIGAAFVVSGTTKLASPSWPRQAAGIGAPNWAAAVVPWVEIVLGASCAAGLARRWTALAIAALLAAFTVLLSTRLLQGRRPVCACFGSLSERPISWWSVARNIALLAVAVVAAVA